MASSRDNTQAPASSEEHAEVECKFLVPNPVLLANLPDMLVGMDLRISNATRQTLRDTYLDTADWWLYRAGLACRLRRVDDSASLEFKTVAPVRNGLAKRTEFREALPSAPDGPITELPGKRLRSWLAPLMPTSQFEAKIELAQTRALYQAVSPEDMRVDVSGDLVRLGDGKEFAEIEIELVDGTPEMLAAFGREFADRFGLRVAASSKFETGLQTAGTRLPRSAASADLALHPADRFVDAAYKVLRREFNTLLWNEPGTRLGLDTEYLHDMRVAARRMRAALRVFRDALPPRRLSGLKRELKWLGAALGRVRDLDVSLLNLETLREQIGPRYRDSLKRYQEELAVRREKARTALIESLDTKRFSEFVERCRRFFAAGPPASPGTPLAAQPALAAAPQLIRRQMKRVRKGGRALSHASSDADLHALRIRCKRLRYAGEFFTDLYGPAAARYALRVREVQTILGDHQDAVVAQGLLDEFARTIRAPRNELSALHLAFGQLIGLEARRAAEKRSEFFAAWKKFARRKVRRPFLKRLAKRNPSAPPATPESKPRNTPRSGNQT